MINHVCKIHKIEIKIGEVCPFCIEDEKKKIRDGYQSIVNFVFWIGIIGGCTVGAIIGFLVGLVL